MASTIGIKVANGEFYSIMEENSQEKKRLVLTTVHDNQGSVQIDLYRSSTQTMADALYVGSLVVEKIAPKLKGEPSIELVISFPKNGSITAFADDLDSTGKKERNTLNVSLESLDESSLDTNIPDFELEEDELPSGRLYGGAGENLGREDERKFPWLIVICAALILTAIGLAIWLFAFQSGNSLRGVPGQIRQMFQRNQGSASSQVIQPPAPPVSEVSPSVQIQQAPPVQTLPTQAPQQSVEPSDPQPAVQTSTAQPEQTSPTQPVPVIQSPVQAPAASAPVRRERPPAPVASYAVPSVIPSGGVPYRIRYGDTLWDIAEAFYRNPLLYPRIARFNNIRNPDFIISGTTIRVPPRN